MKKKKVFLDSNRKFYYGFPNIEKLKEHIRIESPMLRNKITGIRKLKIKKRKGGLYDKKTTIHSVYFKR